MIISQNPSNQNPENDAQYHYPGGPNQMVKVGHAGIANSKPGMVPFSLSWLALTNIMHFMFISPFDLTDVVD